MIPLAFYAPLKSPNHPVPSGDRAMGRLLLSALRLAGFGPELASELRSLDLAGDAEAQQRIRAAGETEARRLAAVYQTRPRESRPRLWLTYHCYYKAPDWIGPPVAEALGIPYAVAEGSRSARRAFGAFALGHAGSEAALDRADCLFVMTPHDEEDLAAALRPGQRLVSLPPFLQADAWTPPPREAPHGDPSRLLAVAMMREGDKLASYRLLAEALARLPAEAPWRLDIVGDGPAREAVESLFARFGERACLRGAVHDPAALAALYGASDLLVWPAIGEAYGMTLLEAQACGCPVLAGREGGVPAILREGETGLLAPPRDAGAFAAMLAGLLADPARLRAMRGPALRFVRSERDLPQAAAILRSALGPLADATQAAS